MKNLINRDVENKAWKRKLELRKQIPITEAQIKAERIFTETMMEMMSDEIQKEQG